MTTSSIEAQWQSQAERRRRIIRLMLFVVVILLVLLACVWFWVTQPLLSRARPNSERTVDPSRLEAHVRKLSIELGPRDASHIENLNRVAAYIKDEFSQTTAHVQNNPIAFKARLIETSLLILDQSQKSESSLAHTTIQRAHCRAPTTTRA